MAPRKHRTDSDCRLPCPPPHPHFLPRPLGHRWGGAQLLWDSHRASPLLSLIPLEDPAPRRGSAGCPHFSSQLKRHRLRGPLPHVTSPLRPSSMEVTLWSCVLPSRTYHLLHLLLLSVAQARWPATWEQKTDLSCKPLKPSEHITCEVGRLICMGGWEPTVRR